MTVPSWSRAAVAAGRCLTVPLASQAPAPQTRRSRPRSSTSMSMRVVTDATGAVVKDLRKEDFQIFEDGKSQSIAGFAFVEIPVVTGSRSADSGPREPDVASNEEPFAGRDLRPDPGRPPHGDQSGDSCEARGAAVHQRTSLDQRSRWPCCATAGRRPAPRNLRATSGCCLRRSTVSWARSSCRRRSRATSCFSPERPWRPGRSTILSTPSAASTRARPPAS